MQRRQRGDLANLGEDVLVDEGGIAKVPTALNDAVTNASILTPLASRSFRTTSMATLWSGNSMFSVTFLEPLAAWVKVPPVKQTRSQEPFADTLWDLVSMT